jgi:hypothetical protein
MSLKIALKGELRTSRETYNCKDPQPEYKQRPAGKRRGLDRKSSNY